MFTGIVSELGEVESVTATDDGARLRVRAGLASELKPGDSVAVAGACLTATNVGDGAFDIGVLGRQDRGHAQLRPLHVEGRIVPADRAFRGRLVVRRQGRRAAQRQGGEEQGFPLHAQAPFGRG